MKRVLISCGAAALCLQSLLAPAPALAEDPADAATMAAAATTCAQLYLYYGDFGDSVTQMLAEYGRRNGLTGEQVSAKRQELRANMANAIQERRLDEDVLLDMYSVKCKDLFGIATPPQTTGRLVQPSAATYPGFAAIAGKTWRCSMTVPDYRDDMDDVLTFAVNVGFGVEKNFKVTGTIQFGVNFEGESSPRFATYQIGGWGYETQWSYGPYVKFYTTVNEMALPRGRWPTYPIQFYITKQADGTFQLSGQLDRASDLKRINLEYCSVITP